MYGRIYKITNLINGKIYVGQTTRADVYVRFNEHSSEKRNRHVSSAIKKYGKDNFTIEVIAEAASQYELNELESKLVTELNCLFPNGYNHRAGGNQNGLCSEITKSKISNSKKGKASPNKGLIQSEEMKKRISLSLGGQSIKATNLLTGECFVLETAHAGRKYGFNPSNIVSICKKHGRRFKTKNHTFEYIVSHANQSGSTENNNSGHAQRIGIETASAE